jgi:hypothetical protein
MSDDRKVTGVKAKRFDVMRLIDLLPRTLWVEDADSVLRHCLFNLDQTSDEEAGQIAH